jgi:hypothetical protein
MSNVSDNSESVKSDLLSCRFCSAGFTPRNRHQVTCGRRTCRDKLKAEYALAYKQSQRDRRREQGLTGERYDYFASIESRHGLDRDAYDELLKLQDGHCALCPNELNLVVDHDHSCCSTKCRSCGGCIRGLLCNVCNLRLSVLERDLDWLERAIEYISSRSASAGRAI